MFYFLEIDISILLFLFVLSFLYDPPTSRPTFSAGMFKALFKIKRIKNDFDSCLKGMCHGC